MNTAKTPKFYRQRLLLALLKQSGGTLSKMDFQKLLFLLHQESGFQLKKCKRIALTCFEAEPEMCHRHCISDYLEKYEKARVVHL